MVLLGSCPYLFITLRGETCVPKEEIEGYMEVRRRIGQKKNRIGKWKEGVMRIRVRNLVYLTTFSICVRKRGYLRERVGIIHIP